MDNFIRPNGHQASPAHRCILVNGPVIVGAGPSGLATAACLRAQGVPFVVLERSDCIASLWQKRTYDRLKLHLPKQFCELPNAPFPDDYPEYPSKGQFIEYLESYATRFQVDPHFNESVESARFDPSTGFWHVSTLAAAGGRVEYICKWLVAATGENAEKVIPEIDGICEFAGEVLHAGDYKSGEKYGGKRVLVVGCGNSGMEVALDLCNHDASPSIVVRSSVHVLPREILGKSTFELAVMLMTWLPIWVVDKVILILAWLLVGDMGKYGIRRPSVGPMELKSTSGKTPVLDVGALEKIRSGDIRVVPGISRFLQGQVELDDGRRIDVDSVILATGYRSNVPCWLQESEFFGKNGMPNLSLPNGWKGKCGLYAVGFARRGLSGASSDAIKIAQDIAKLWKEDTKARKKPLVALQRRCISQL